MGQPKDALLQLLDDVGLKYVDKRQNKGALWVIGGRELRGFMRALESTGVWFSFSPNGGKASKHQEAWYSYSKNPSWSASQANKLRKWNFKTEAADQVSKSEETGVSKKKLRKEQLNTQQEKPSIEAVSDVKTDSVLKNNLQNAKEIEGQKVIKARQSETGSPDLVKKPEHIPENQSSPNNHLRENKRLISFNSLDIAEARKWCSEIDSLPDEDFESLVANWHEHEINSVDSRYEALRSSIIQAFDESGGLKLSSRKMYPVDVEVGLTLYTVLSTMGFTVVDAGNDDIWRYLTIRVFPDITYMRYPDPDDQANKHGERINNKRFFSHTRRIWLKTLWWYVHLSWQGDVEKTRKVIEGNSADMIGQLIERCGRGYRYELYRSFMYEFSTMPNRSTDLFKKAAKLNLARCRLVEPALTLGGVDEYCTNLFNDLNHQ